ncbi:MAG: hypothetical protein KAG19_08940 [Methylococcales bacterium]|nr:hypothetical protein [Methylococcales bacterium]
MTVLVVVKKNNKVVIAADTLVHMGSTLKDVDSKVNHDKIIKYKDTWFAYTGASMSILMLNDALQEYGDELNFNGVKNIYQSSLKLHQILKNNYFLLTDDGSKDQAVQDTQLHLLIANASGIYEMSGDRNITEIPRFWSSGSGMRFALGAMHASYDRLGDPAEIATIGVEAACKYETYCGLPMTLYQCKLNQVD